MAHITIPAKERDYFINELINGEPKASIYMNYKNDDTSKRIDYVSDDEDDPVVLELDESNYYELAFTYLNWKNGGGYKKCKNCGKLFRVRHNAIDRNDKNKNELSEEALYCRSCAPKYDLKYKGKDKMALDYEPKKIICVDCGEEVYLENFMASKTCRCGQCQMQRDKIKKSERNKRYYEAHKN